MKRNNRKGKIMAVGAVVLLMLLMTGAGLAQVGDPEAGLILESLIVSGVLSGLVAWLIIFQVWAKEPEETEEEL